MSSLVTQDLDVSRLLLDLRLCAEVVNGFAGWLEPEAIAHHVTEGLVERFSCSFARVWIITPDRLGLKLVASSGLYTRLDGSFSWVPMGHFKIGKIAQHCIPFLSNCLSEETWVKDKQWAIENNIQGFAGLPLMEGEQAIGVLAIFSKTPMNPEFLEVLQMMCLSVAGALSSALNHQSLIAQAAANKQASSESVMPLSEQLSGILGRQALSMLGMEKSLSPSVHQLMIKLASRLAEFSCHYGRLVYDDSYVVLETMLAVNEGQDQFFSGQAFAEITSLAQALGGALSLQANDDQTVIAVHLRLPQQSQGSVDGQAAAPAKSSSSLLTLSQTAISPLSEREHEVVQLLAQGFRDREIAEQLYISERTVKFHAKNMLTKLDVKTRVQAVFKATKKGWLS